MLTNTISIPSRNRSKATATVTRRWCSNAGMAASKFAMRCGNTWNLEKTKRTVTIRPKICHVTKRCFRNWTPGPTGLPASSKRKATVEPGQYRAFGYKPPGHLLHDVRLPWRDIRMRFGSPRFRSSSAKQQRLDLNRDVTKEPKKSEGEKLRDRVNKDHGW